MGDDDRDLIEDRLLTIPEVATYLGWHRRTVERRITAGHLRAVKLGAGTTRVPLSALEEFVASGMTEAAL